MTVTSPHLRLTVIEQIYYQRPGEDATQVQNNFVLHPVVGEQIYNRKTFATQERLKVDVGWIQNAVCLQIKNIEAFSSQTLPSDEERDELETHVLEVFTGDHTEGFLLAPGESLRVRPRKVGSLEIVSLKGTTRYEVNVFPD